MPKPALFCNRFLTDSRSADPPKTYKNQRKIDDFAKLGCAVPRRKIVVFGHHFGAKTRSKSIKTEVRKRIGNRTLFGSHFCRFWEDFGAPDHLQNRPKNQKFFAFWRLGSQTGSGGVVWTVLGVPGTNFVRFLDHFGSDFGRFQDDFGTLLGGSGPLFDKILGPSLFEAPGFEERTSQPLLRNQTLKNLQ